VTAEAVAGEPLAAQQRGGDQAGKHQQEQDACRPSSESECRDEEEYSDYGL
jgi:hypothetical protein